ncbi:hypothetical protein GCM10025866_13630 [Naasia aerilata]|uniref:Phosphoribosyltransferase domain-containing protein n=1 Tax=Naasia aerilata TaxID=1162966 RepID=A0ABN6XKI1_9MICO|nr:hypothetical protein GCM10025866_13630 [Naasia aerilata]
MTDLYAYKDPAVTAEQREKVRGRLYTMLLESLMRHHECLRQGHGLPFSALATVPSTSGRVGPHPLEFMLGMFDPAIRRARVSYIGPTGLDAVARRIFDPSRFRANRNQVGGRHVLLLEDTWVSGGRTQSVAAALKAAGAARVSVVTLGRELKPSYGPTREYLRTHEQRPFDPAICPVTGQRHQ